MALSLQNRVDGPPPLRPRYGLVQAAESPASGVTMPVDGDERWMGGVKVFPFPIDNGEVHILGAEKSDGPDDVPSPEFDAICAVLADSCTSYRVWSQDEYRSRLMEAFSAVESSIVADEFLRGAQLNGQPHLSDGEGEFPNGDTVTSVKGGMCLLEEQIALSRRGGLIHCSPSVLLALSAGGFAVEDQQGVVRTINGTVVIPDYGYAGGSQPTGHADGEWIYATGPIDIRRTDPFLMPENVSEALDRGFLGDAGSTPNKITFRVERYYVVDWDTVVQAAVLVDVCKETCASVGT